MNTNNLKTRIKSLKNDNKKVWETPELDVLDGRKTYNGGDSTTSESDIFCDDADDCTS
jgi:hypothetical protein